MNNINITELPNGLYKLTPQQGYILIDEQGQTYSEAVVKNTHGWNAKKV